MFSQFLRVITLISTFAGGVAGSTIYSNGLPDQSDGLDLTANVQTSDFTLASSATFNAIRIWAALGTPVGSIYWAVVNDVGGSPGTSILSSGLVSTIAATATGDSLAGFDVYQLDFATGNVALSAGTFWLVLHHGDLTINAVNDIYWLAAAANSTFSGHEAIVSGGSHGAFTSNGIEHAFELRHTSEVPEPSTWMLFCGSALALWGWKNSRKLATIATVAGAACFGQTDPVLHPGTPTFDRPTLASLGVVLPVTGDTNYNSRVEVRYRRTGTVAWKNAQPLFRVRPETVTGTALQPHFAGSIFHLRPGVSYDVELQAIDPDGGNQTFQISSSTRAVPSDPTAPRHVSVNGGATALQTALNNSVAGDIITLADGVYSGTFSMSHAGAPGNPIVIRGSSQGGTILDGTACTGCNVIEVYGAGYVHIENLTIRNAERAVRFQTSGSTGNVVRRVRITGVSAAIGARDGQRDFYIADSLFEGPIVWPSTYGSDGGAQSGFDAIGLAGDGHVVAHNVFSGWADSIWQWSPNARALDVYGNDFKDQYDNSVELDFSAGNTRFFRNRITNAYMPVSVQPVRGGPAYIFRNVAANIVNEPLKFHGQGTEVPSGVLVYQNTFVTADIPLQTQTTAANHWFTIRGNLFIGPPTPPRATVVEWTAPIHNGVFNNNGYYPEGTFAYNFAGVGYRQYPSLAAAQTGAGVEAQGYLAGSNVFASGYVGSLSYSVQQAPPNLTLAPNSPALDRPFLLANINDSYRGAGPDTGALELGCPAPVYGPRSLGSDESNTIYGCEASEASGSVNWVRDNTTTRGTWPGVFGSRGWSIAGEGTSTTSAAAIGQIGVSPTIWANPSSSFRALRKTPPSLARIASGWTGASQLTIELSARDSSSVRLAAYFLDWQTTPRSQTVEFLDALTGAVIAPPRTYTAFQNGIWSVWQFTGRVRMRITEGTPGQGVTLSGLFFD